MLSRRHVLAGAAAVAAAPLLLQGQASAAEGTDWVEWLATHRDNVGVFADDGRGGRIAHQACRLSPLASAYKAIHAATDYLHGLLGVPALIGQWLRLWWPGTNDELARRFLTDPEFRAAARARPAPGLDAQLAWAKTTHRGSAADVASLHRAIATERIPGRNYLEFAFSGSLEPGELGIGYKGGELAGVINAGFSLRRTDGTVATSAVLVSDLAADDYITLHSGVNDFILGLCLGMLRDPATWQRVSRELVHA